MASKKGVPEAAASTVLSAEDQHRISRAIADPTRFAIFQQIAAGRCLACAELREHLSVTAPTVSHHLKELEAAGLIATERAGKFMNLTFRRGIWRAYLETLAKIEGGAL